MKILEIQPMSEHMDATHCSQAAERTGSLKILLYPYLLNPCGRLNAACCEISTRIARLLDLALRNFHLEKCLHALFAGRFFFVACDDDYKMVSQAKIDGPMRAAMRTS